MTSIKGPMRRLERLQQACGGPPDQKKADPDADVDFSQMTPYEVQQYKLATRMRNFRLKMAELEALGPNADVSKRAAAANFLRRERTAMQADLRACEQKVGRDANNKSQFEQLSRHLKNTDEFYRRSTRGGGDGDDYGTVPTARGVTRVDDLDSADIVGGGGPSIRDDPEFQEFFLQIHKNDKKMDEQLSRIHAGVQRLNQNALVIKDELKIQDVILSEIEVKVDNSYVKLKGLNKKLKETLKKVDRDRMFLYVFCFILLLALAGGCYYIFSSRD